MCDCYCCQKSEIILDSCHCISCVLQAYDIDVDKCDEELVFCCVCKVIFVNPDYIVDNAEYCEAVELLINHNCKDSVRSPLNII